MDTLIIFTAKYLIYISAIIFVIASAILLRRGYRDYALTLVIAVFTAIILAKIASRLYFDPRPFMLNQTPPLIPHSPENGFPSSHTLASVLMGLVLWKYNRRVAALLLVFALCIGISRVLAQVHHALDIVGAAVIALIAVVLAEVIIKHGYIMKLGKDK